MNIIKLTERVVSHRGIEYLETKINPENIVELNDKSDGNGEFCEVTINTYNNQIKKIQVSQNSAFIQFQINNQI